MANVTGRRARLPLLRSAPPSRPQIPRYDYTPLEDPEHMVRVLRCSENGRCEVQSFKLDACPSFNALSYTWGPSRHEGEIFIDSKKLLVSKNLLSFLQTEHALTGWWWIDQISIDQSRPGERNMQVSIMADIYRTASQVVVWLNGLPDRTCQALSVQLAADDLSEWILERYDGDILNLLEHRYWSRIWVIQELLFANKVEVLYGSSRMTIGQVQRIIQHHKHGSAEHRHRASWLIERATSLGRDNGGGLQPLPKVLNFIANGGCSDVRDTVFGIQGVLKPEFRQRIDYSKTAGEVFVETMRILSRTWPEDQTISHLLSMCLKLGEMMLPDLLSLHRLVELGLSNTLQKIIEVQKLPQHEAEMAKEHIVAIFMDVVSSSGKPAQTT